MAFYSKGVPLSNLSTYTDKMKKTYFTPTFEIIRLQSAGMMAASIPIKGETDAEARSREFWGTSLTDDTNDEEENTGSWF